MIEGSIVAGAECWGPGGSSPFSAFHSALRENERLATLDRGIVLYRLVLFREIERVRQGLDPRAVIRDPDHSIFDTNLDQSARGRLASGVEA